MTALILAAGVLVPGLARAQSPWTVYLSTVDPLPIPFCNQIQLRVFDESGRNVPRNPLGYPVTMEHFDITVTAPDGKSVAAQRIDASHWVACACLGAPVGTVGTITATYPAAALAERSRVPDVAFTTTAQFTIGAAKGTINSQACLAGAAGGGVGAGVAGAAGARATTRPLAVGTALPKTAVATGTPRTAAYFPLDVTVAPGINATGSFAVPGEVTVTFTLDAEGAFEIPGEATVTFGLSAIGNWVGAPASNFTTP